MKKLGSEVVVAEVLVADAFTSKEESGQARAQRFPQISSHLYDSRKALPHCAPAQLLLPQEVPSQTHPKAS